MSNDFNLVVFIGRLSADPELKKAGEKNVCTFTLANNREISGNKSVSFFRCTAWEKTAGAIKEHCHKGDKVMVVGRIDLKSWPDKDGNVKSSTEVSVREVYFLGSPSGRQGNHPDDVPEGERVSNPFAEE